MREFKNRLLKHFDFEENSGFFDLFPLVKLQGDKFSKKLKQEHKQLMRDLDKILVRLRRIHHANNPKLKKIESEILHLISQIYRHEDSEIKVLDALDRKNQMVKTT